MLTFKYRHDFTPQHQDIIYVNPPDDAATVPTRLSLQMYSGGWPARRG
jgi:hypothetical protein